MSPSQQLSGFCPTHLHIYQTNLLQNSFPVIGFCEGLVCFMLFLVMFLVSPQSILSLVSMLPWLCVKFCLPLDRGFDPCKKHAI